MQKPNPRGCCGNPGICLKCAQGQKSLKGLPRATRCTDRAQISGNVSLTVELCPPHRTFGTKVRARRDVPEGHLKTQLYIYILSSHFSLHLAPLLFIAQIRGHTTAHIPLKEEQLNTSPHTLRCLPFFLLLS